MKTVGHFAVGGHGFCLTTGIDDFRMPPNYDPFAEVDPSNPPVFTLSVDSESRVEYTEEMRQEDDSQTIICGKTPEGLTMFEFRWLGVTAGWLLCSEEYRQGHLTMTGEYRQVAIDNALMVMYALATAGMKTALFHAAVVSIDGKGYMFLGPSGTGKSTHAGLWLRHIDGTELVNDDNPVVRIADDGRATVYGTPWSGKTACYRNVSYPLGSIVRLSQGTKNRIRRLQGVSAYAAIIPSISGNRWERRIADGLHATESTLASTVPVWQLECRPDRESAKVCKSAITASRDD